MKKHSILPNTSFSIEDQGQMNQNINQLNDQSELRKIQQINQRLKSRAKINSQNRKSFRGPLRLKHFKNVKTFIFKEMKKHFANSIRHERGIVNSDQRLNFDKMTTVKQLDTLFGKGKLFDPSENTIERLKTRKTARVFEHICRNNLFQDIFDQKKQHKSRIVNPLLTKHFQNTSIGSNDQQ